MIISCTNWGQQTHARPALHTHTYTQNLLSHYKCDPLLGRLLLLVCKLQPVELVQPFNLRLRDWFLPVILCHCMVGWRVSFVMQLGIRNDMFLLLARGKKQQDYSITKSEKWAALYRYHPKTVCLKGDLLLLSISVYIRSRGYKRSWKLKRPQPTEAPLSHRKLRTWTPRQ